MPYWFVDIKDIPDTPEGELLKTAIGRLMVLYPHLTPNQILKMLIDIRQTNEEKDKRDLCRWS